MYARIQEWEANTKEPYTHRAIIKTLNTGYFATKSSLANRLLEEFPKQGDKLSMPIAFLALGATAVGTSRFLFLQ